MDLENEFLRKSYVGVSWIKGYTMVCCRDPVTVMRNRCFYDVWPLDMQ